MFFSNTAFFWKYLIWAVFISIDFDEDKKVGEQEWPEYDTHKTNTVESNDHPKNDDEWVDIGYFFWDNQAHSIV